MASTIQDRELNERLMSLADTFAKGNVSLQNALREQAKKMVGAQEDIYDAYEAELNDKRGWTTKSSKQARAHLIKLHRLENEKTNIIQAASAKEKKLREDANKLLQRQTDIQAKLANTGLGKKKRDSLTAELKSVNEGLRQTSELKAKTRAETLNALAISNKAGRERAVLEAAQMTRTARWGDSLRTSIGKATTGAITAIVGNATLGTAFVKVATDAKDAILTGMKTGGFGISTMTEGMGGGKFNVHAMAQYGMNPAEAVKMQAVQRRTILSASRGMDEFMDGLEAAHKNMDDITASPLEKTEIALKSYDTAAAAGIKLNKASATMFRDNMKKNSILTGETGVEFADHIKNITDSEEIQAALRQQTNEQDRIATLANIQAQYTQCKAMGMTSEAAMKTTKYLTSMSTRKAKTTLEEGVRMQALASTMGMGGQGARWRELHMKRNTKTAAEMEEYRQIAANIRNESDRRSGGVVDGNSMVQDALTSVLKLDETIGAEINTTLTQGLAPQQAALDKLTEIPQAVKDVATELSNIASVMQNNPIGQMGTGAVGSLMQSLAGSGGGSFLGTLAARFIPTAGAAASGTAAAGGAASAAGGVTAAGVASAAGVAALAAAAVAAGGTAIYAGVKAAKGEDASNWISEGFDKMTGGWNMFEAMDKAVGGPMSQMAKKQEDEDKALKDAIAARKAKLATEVPKKAEVVNPETVKAAAVAAKASPEEEKAKEDKKKADIDATKRMETISNVLKEMSDTSAKHLDVAEKQLVALTMTEQERTSASNVANLRKDNRFSSNYGYA